MYRLELLLEKLEHNPINLNKVKDEIIETIKIAISTERRKMNSLFCEILNYEGTLHSELVRNKEMLGNTKIGKLREKYIQGQLSSIRVAKKIIEDLEIDNNENE